MTDSKPDPTSTQSPAKSWVTVAHLLRPQGRKGELLADLLTDFPDRFTTHPHVFLAPTAKPDARTPIEVESHWLPLGKNAGRIVLKFSGIDSIEAAKALAHSDVLIPAEDRLPLEDGAFYISDLAGCTVLSAGHAIGIIADVQFATSPDGAVRLSDAAPILAVESPEGKEILIPFVRDFLGKIDLKARRVEMNLPNGLIDIYL